MSTNHQSETPIRHPHLKIVNKSGMGRWTRVYLVTEDGQEIDLSRITTGATITENIDGVVRARVEFLMVVFETVVDTTTIDGNPALELDYNKLARALQEVKDGG